MPETKRICVLVRINVSWKHFFDRKCYVNANPDIMQGEGILSERKNSVE
jgi:hypothetical protein